MNTPESDPVYFIPAGDYFGKTEDACFLVYSPFAGKSFLALPNESERLSHLPEGKRHEDAIFRQLLPEQKHMEQMSMHAMPEMTSMELILNEKCNFNCPYCYSAGSRSSSELSGEHIEAGIRFIHECALKHARKDVEITFIGGGEPLLSWDLIESAVAFSSAIRKDDCINTKWGLITNGSLFTDEKIAFCKEHGFEIQFSFEILERIQNLQRNSFDIVSNNLKKVLAAGCNAYVRSTITEANVDLLPEMAETCLRDYPGVKHLGCEPVTDENMAKNPERMRSFFNRYFESFLTSYPIWANTDLCLSSSSTRSRKRIRKRFCGPILVLQTNGEFVSCAHFSSPQIPGFQDFRYGCIRNNKIEISKDDFYRIYPDTLPDKCNTCWARWNCGGGCNNHRYLFSEEAFDIVCEARRKLLRLELLYTLERKFKTANGRDFKASITAILEKN